KPVASVSLCLIVKDGESGLERCLKSAADLVQEIIVVDTGSSDRSPEIARECGARVFDFPWQDSFAAARNESIHHATGDWIFWLDADEYLDEDNRARLGRLLAGLGHDNAAYIMKQRSPPNAAGSNALVADQARLFPNHPQIRWQYRVHEQILPAVLRLGGTIHWTDIFIQHGGYEDATLRHHKHERNLRLLELEVQEHPDDAFTLFNLGWTYLEMGRAAEAIPLLRRSLERTPAGGTTIRKQYALLAKAHRKLGQPEEALAACREGRTHFPEDIELLHQEGLLRFERGDLTGAEACLVRLLESRPENYFAIGVDPGLRGYQTWYKLGIIYRDQGKLAAAEAQWRAVLAERPEHAPAWIGLTDLLLSQGRYQEVEEMARRLDQEPARILEAALIRGRLYLARREFATARALLEDLIPKYPQAVWLRVVLSHVLLREDRDPAATERALRGVLALDPANAQARDNLAQLLRQAGSPGRDFKGQPAPV
ncbi:MAG: tetratricopeptide repeat protein, partial [Planctomycetes bacterium]|nr:tetratricopeptide repeat protein [Planctomycetota bacterium]